MAALRATTDAGDTVTAEAMGGTMARYAIFGADDLAERYGIAVRAVVRHRRREAEREWMANAAG
jgi:hypothetical protein